MLRRSFLIGGAGLAVYGLPRFPHAHERLEVGVIGGGIVGASIAFHLAQAGAAVTLFEKAGPASGATGKSLAWINPVVVDKTYMALRLESMLAWRELDARLQLGVTWGGSIVWTNDPQKAPGVQSRAAALQGTSDAARILTAEEFKRISPAITPGPVAAAFFAPADGHVDPVRATTQFLDHARRSGAKVLFPCEVQAIELQHGRLAGVATSQGRFALDRLVIAAGVDTPHLLSMTGYELRLQHAPAIMAHTLPTRELTKIAYDVTGELEFKQMADGRLAATYIEGPPDLPVHSAIRDHITEFPDEAIRKKHGESLYQKVSQYLPGARNATLDRVMIGFRPMPLDRLPVVGAIPGTSGVHVAVTHSGVTLAPILGRYVTREVLSSATVDQLGPYRPERFSAKPSRSSAAEDERTDHTSLIF